MDLVFTATPASGMQDVAALANVASGPITTAGTNGTVWRSSDGGASFIQVNASGFRRVAVSPDGSVLWGVGTNGTVWWSKIPNQWTRLDATSILGSPVEDVVINHDNWLWVVTTRGGVWSLHDGVHFEWHATWLRFKRLAFGRGNQLWGIDSDGALWQQDRNLAPDNWYQTNGAGMEDLTVSNTGEVWLVGANGTVWTTRDGQTFAQTAAQGFLSVSASGDIIWLVGKNGSLWKGARPVPASKPPATTPPGTPTSPPSLTKMLRLSVNNQATTYYSIDSVTWRIWRADAGASPLVMTGTGMSIAASLLSGRQYYIHADVGALSAISGEIELAEFRGGALVNGFPVHTIVLARDQSQTYRLIAEPIAFTNLINPVTVV
jgi:hypothetical protein